MSTLAEPEQEAAAYMDRIRIIIQKYGLGDSVDAEKYDHAVDSVAAAFAHLAPSR